MAKKQAKKQAETKPVVDMEQIKAELKEELKEEMKKDMKTEAFPISEKIPASEAVKVELAMKKKRERSKKILEEGPQVATFIPLEPGEQEGAICRVRHNGNVYEYEKGVQHTVPVPINAIIMESVGIRQKADSGSHKLRADRDQKTIEALS